MRPSARRRAGGLALLLALCSAAALLTITTGEYPIPLPAVWDALHGQGDPAVRMVVLGFRLPRLAAGLAVGAGLGVAGAIFQSVCRNPLASPDVLGTVAGSATGALLAMLLFGQARLGVACCSIAGGAAAALLLYRLANRRSLQGERLILVGIGLAATLTAVNEYLLTRAELDAAIGARTWLYGSLNGLGWPLVIPAAAGAAMLVPAAALLGPRLRILELGDELAAGLGVDCARSRRWLLGLAIGLAALCTATAGPIHFLALVAPPLGRHVCRSPGTSIAASAATGAALLVVADLIAQRAFAPFQLPVGLVTSAIGGAYLVHVLSRMSRVRR